MSLQSPKKMAQGSYQLTLTSPTPSPRLSCKSTGWILSDDWVTWATEQRQRLIGEMVSHGNWFSRPPRRDVLEPLFAPWTGKTMQGELKIFCTPPELPKGSGSAVWVLESLTMTSSAITPNWSVREFVEEQDTISLFGDADTVDDEDEREIQFEDIEFASPAAAPTKMRNREWEAAKFLAKERVREARLKTQIADRLAAKEEARFYAKFGDLDETESRFSEYDLTEDEAEGGSDSDQP